jgi:hypothetical protein
MEGQVSRAVVAGALARNDPCSMTTQVTARTAG